MQRLYGLLIGVLLCSCQTGESGQSSEEPTRAVYHWQSKAALSLNEKQLLEEQEIEKMYLHYFDVTRRSQEGAMQSLPVAVLKEVDEYVKTLHCIPVVFITNEVFKRDQDYQTIAERIHQLVDQISMHHFGTQLEQLQIDCDWTASTRSVFFAMLEELKPHFDLSVTIRLHQLKFAERTGVPPVDRGTLMLYNVGELSNFSENSILTSKVVDQYLTPELSYQIPLDLALPIFSQTVVKNNAGKLRLLNRNLSAEMMTKAKYFEQQEAHQFLVLRDTLFHSFYLYEGFGLKVESFDIAEVKASERLVEQTNLVLKDRIYYHLDEPYLGNLKALLDSEN